jgi:pimeloyl-ACP methyl ester carboxylesterase
VTTEATNRPNVVLVHGAFHGPWVWDAVAEGLREQGWEVHAVTLPSVADQTAPSFGLHDDAAAIGRILDTIAGPVVAVAHSYGGIPMTEAAANSPKVSHLIYLAAFCIDVDDSLLSALGWRLAKWSLMEGDKLSVVGPAEVFYADVEPEAAELAINRLRSSSLASFGERLGATLPTSVRSTYVICEQDCALPPDLQRHMALRCDDVRTLPTGHSPMLSAPADVITIIAEVGRGTDTAENDSPANTSA